VKGIQNCTNDEDRPFPRGDNSENVKIYRKSLKIFFSRTTGPISTKLDRKHPCVKGIQNCTNDDDRPFPRGDNSENVKIYRKSLKIFFSRTTGPISTKLGRKHPWVKDIQNCTNDNDRPFPRGDNSENVKIYRKSLKIFFSRTTGPISTKLDRKHPCMKGIQNCTNDDDRPFPRGDNSENVKIYRKSLKIFFSRTTGPISTKLGRKHPWVKGIQNCTNDDDRPFPRGDNSKNVKNTENF
jgi:hypothetical protein